jgi:hypothetical protein
MLTAGEVARCTFLRSFTLDHRKLAAARPENRSLGRLASRRGGHDSYRMIQSRGTTKRPSMICSGPSRVQCQSFPLAGEPTFSAGDNSLYFLHKIRLQGISTPPGWTTFGERGWRGQPGVSRPPHGRAAHVKPRKEAFGSIVAGRIADVSRVAAPARE